MPITYHLKPEYNLIIIVHKGRIPDDVFLVFYKQLYQDNIIDQSMNLLVDLREADSSERSVEVLNHFADFLGDFHEGRTIRSKVAVVAPKDLSFSLSSMYGYFTHSMQWDFIVFRAIDAALAWLGVSEDLMLDFDQNVQK